jgi:lipopolysaccharide/colanic/teichoic acid biosynthesis glycosyltransferase
MTVNEFVAAEHDRVLPEKRGLSGGVPSLASRVRFQLLGGLVAAVLLPGLIRHRFENFPDAVAHYDTSLWGTFFAFLLSYFVFRKVTGFPGVRTTAFIIPAFLGSYALVLAAFFLLRLEYSRLQFVLSFGFAALFFYGVLHLVRRTTSLRLFVIPGGEADNLVDLDLKMASIRPLAAPSEASKAGVIVADLESDLGDDWERAIASAVMEGRRVYNARDVMESLTGRVQVRHISESPFGSLTPNLLYASAKRFIDQLLALVALIALLPLLILIGLAIRADSPGPALFRQERMGFRGRPFIVYKFRTMRMQAGPVSAETQMTRSDDDRITRTGRFFRRTRIDELPQIINILRGEMSWIGPRPEAINLSKLYESRIPFYTYRHVVRPGITGWAQVNQGHVTSVDDADMKLQYDFFYVKNFSVWLDILVLLRTVRVVLTGTGAR